MTAEEQLQLLEKVVELLEQQMGNNLEIVLHDLRKPYEHTIVDIRNGHISGREIGGCGSDRGLEVMRGTVKNGDEFNYITRTPDGKVLRSSSLYFRDDTDKVVASLCVNQDITDTLKMESLLHGMNKYAPDGQGQRNEVLAGNIQELMNRLIEESLQTIGKPAAEMTRAEKKEMVRLLDEKGLFLITYSGETVCEVLDISKYTLYKYLEAIRSETDKNQEKGTDCQ
ncbi:MAG: helix-turn-helix transcriptional regulator [Candidatus Limiplasma sp.]|nr:helix-turn-helix transcriptional regulator [Clostridiales bacterium]MDY3816482.1 helix-turn-helix transcriptional regulator [Candidatus Limiplasma sp.]